MKNKKQYLEKIPFWNRLSNREKQYMTNNSVIRDYDRGELLYEGTDNCLGLLYVISGTVRVCIISEDGREITLFRIQKEEDCVMSASCVISQLTFETVMNAEEKTQLLILNPNALQQLAEDNIYVKSYLYQRISDRFSQVMWVLQEIVFKRFDQRLAKFLVDEYDKTGVHFIQMTQEEIAQRVNSAREVVARMLRQFSSDGIIKTKRGHIELKDIDTLRQLNNE